MLDRQVRSLVVPLGDGLWAAWDTQACTLEKVWQGDVSWDGPVYTTVHGPQPTSRGMDLNDPLVGAAWKATVDGSEQPVAVSFEGYDAPARGAITLHWKLVLADGEQLRLSEVPERVASDADGHPRFRRTFTPSAVQAGTQLSLVALDRPVAAAPFDMDGNAPFVVTTVLDSPNVPSPRPPHVDARLELRGDQPTHITMAYAQPAAAASLETPSTAAAAPEPISPSPPPDERRAALLAPPHELADPSPTQPGIALRIYDLDTYLSRLAPLESGQTPNVDVVLRTLDLDSDRGDFTALGGPDDEFLAEATTRLRVDEGGTYAFRLTSDDGSRLGVDGRMVIDNDGLHPPESREESVELAAGEHDLDVWMFEAGGGNVLRLQWKPPGAQDWLPLPEDHLSVPAGIVRVTAPGPKRTIKPLSRTRPGDGEWLAGVHPSFELHSARPSGFEPKVGGLALRQDGALLVSTWDRDGAVYALTDARCDDAAQIQVQRTASGLAEPLGLCTVGWRTFVMQKQELTELIDHDGDGVTDEYRCLCNAWPVSPNFHEFGFGLVERDGWLYANLAIAIDPGGRSSMKQAEGRGAAIRVDADSGRFELLAQGLRAPNGIGFGASIGWTHESPPDTRPIFIADNQGDWLPSSKILLLQPGAFYGNRSVLREKADGLHDTPPVAWLPQDEIGNSPSQPAPLDVGPWVGQMIVGDVTHGGLQRIAVDRVGDALNGCVFAFSQGLEAGVNRLCWDRGGRREMRDWISQDLGITDIDYDGLDPVTRRTSMWTYGKGADLYVGGIGSTGNWGQEGKQRFGLQRLQYTGKPCFELLDIRAHHDGLLVDLTEHLLPGLGTDPDGWLVESWRYEPTENYGGPKIDRREHRVTEVAPLDDRTALFLRLPMPEPGRVVHVRALDPLRSAEGHELWSSEAWLTLNAVPDDAGEHVGEQGHFYILTQGGVPPTPVPPVSQEPNVLSAAQAADGFRRLFDGASTQGWHTHGAQPLADGTYPAPAGWTIQDGALVRTGDGGDLVSNDAFRDFELELDWRITEGGNSGILFLVDETPRADGSQPAVWETGIEMQVLDDGHHGDGQNPLTSAGACYGLFAPEKDDTRPVGHWNHVRIAKQGSRVEQWLNGRLQCAYDIGSDDWKARVAASKFRDMPGFARARAGHIALQDHGDEVAYRNIRIHDLSY